MQPRRPFSLSDGQVIDLDDVPPGMDVCYVCGIVPAAGQGCQHPAHPQPAWAA